MENKSEMRGKVEWLIDEARTYRDRGDVVLEGQTRRTLDDLVGVRTPTGFIGGRQLIDGTVSVDRMAAIHGYRW